MMTDEEIGKLIEQRQAAKREVLDSLAKQFRDYCADDDERGILESSGVEVTDSTKDFDIGCQWRRKI